LRQVAADEALHFAALERFGDLECLIGLITICFSELSGFDGVVNCINDIASTASLASASKARVGGELLP